jgi:cytochrome oxidase Cu insertion factor (SCO1/SenC/PrrC family)
MTDCQTEFNVMFIAVDPDPDSIRSIEPYPDLDPEGQKMTHNNRKKLRNFMF